MRYWLMKSEPDEFSIDDLAAAKGKTTSWFGVRNYQARNFMRDQMQRGDQAFLYHSSCAVPGIVATLRVVRFIRRTPRRSSMPRSRSTTDGRVRCGTTIAMVRAVPRDSEAARWLGRYLS